MTVYVAAFMAVYVYLGSETSGLRQENPGGSPCGDPKRSFVQKVDQLMTSFTLDTNCVIDVDEARPAGVHVMRLAKAHEDHRAEVAVVAMMASEKQRSGTYLEDFGAFSDRLRALGLGHLELALPLCYFDICFFNHCLLSSAELSALDDQIHGILFPKVERNFGDFCEKRGLNAKAGFTGKAHEWRNAKCDVQAVWSHIHRKADVFVTSDGNFYNGNARKLMAIGAGRIMSPEAAADLLE